MGLSPLVIPQAHEVGSSPGDQQVVSPKTEMSANGEEPQYAFLKVPPPTPRAARRQKACDVERVRYSKSKVRVPNHFLTTTPVDTYRAYSSRLLRLL